jgi:hypothetical protein
MNIFTMQNPMHLLRNIEFNHQHGDSAPPSNMNRQALNRVKRTPSLPVNQPNTDVQTNGASTSSGVTIRCIDESNKPKGQPNGASSADRVTYCERAKITFKGGQLISTP